MDGRRRRGKTLRSGERKTVLSVFHHFKNAYPEESVRKLVKRTSAATRVSAVTVYRLRKEELRGPLVTPSRKGRKIGSTKRTRLLKYDSFVLSAIRKVVHSFFGKNKPPTLNLVLNQINESENLPKLTRMTLYRILKDIGFRFEKRRNKAMLLERDDIIVWRHSYLRKIREFKRKKKPLVYLDETWVSVGQTTSKLWRDTTIHTPKEAFLAGLTTGLKDPTQRGPRFVILHVGGEDGFVEEGKLVFLAKKGTADFHDEMNSSTFEEWFSKQLLPNLKAGTGIVLDNAPYHSRKCEQIPTSKTRKEDIQVWLHEKGVAFAEDSLRKELLQEVSKIKHLYEERVVDKIAKEKGFTVIRLPPYHCELNPIELVWSQVKRHVAMNNTTFNKNEIPALIDKAFEAVSVQHWKNYCKHVEKVEDKMWKMDSLQDNVEPLIVNLGSSSSEAESDVDSPEGGARRPEVSDSEASQDSVLSGVARMGTDSE